MRYKEIKLVENVMAPTDPSRSTKGLIKYFKADCKTIKGEKRVNQQLTNLRKQLERFPNQRKPVIDYLRSQGETILADLIAATIYPIQLAGKEAQFTATNSSKIIRDLSGWSKPLFSKEMCIGGILPGLGQGGGNSNQSGVAGDGEGGNGNSTNLGNTDTVGNNIAGGDTSNQGDSTQGGGGSDVGGDVGNPGDSTQGGGGSDVGGTIADKFSEEMTTFEGLIKRGDKQGAIDFLDANSEFEAAIGGSFRSDIQNAIDADERAEQARIDAENAKNQEEKDANEEIADISDDEADANTEIVDQNLDGVSTNDDTPVDTTERDQAEKDRKDAEAELKRLEQERDELEADDDANEVPADNSDSDNTDNNTDNTEQPSDDAVPTIEFDPSLL